MKLLFSVILFSFFIGPAMAQSEQTKRSLPDPAKKIQLVDVACGKCKLGLPGKSCELAVRIDGKAYYIDGASIDDFGDAHARDGFCNAIRKAEVQGEVVDNRFKVTYIKLMPEEKNKNRKN